MSELEAYRKQVSELLSKNVILTNVQGQHQERLINLEETVSRLMKWHEPEGINVAPDIEKGKFPRR